MPLDHRIPLRVCGHALDEGAEALDGAVEEGEDGGGPKGEREAAGDVEDSVVEVKDGGFDADGGGLVDYFDREKAL